MLKMISQAEQYKTPFLYLRTSEGDEIWLAVHQCSADFSYKQTEQLAKNTFFEKIRELVRN